MFNASLRWAFLFSLLVCRDATAQSLNIPMKSDAYGNMNPVDVMQESQLQFNMFLVDSRNPHLTDVQSPSGSVSKLDLKAPGKARHEYDQGYRLLMGHDSQGAVDHLAKSITLYPEFVAAHNALGSAYLNLGKNELADSEFSQAIALDDHLPNSYLNLGCAELALKQYAAAEESLRKASSIAPLDVELQLALVYGEYTNHDYSAVLTTAGQVHAHKHEGASLVHYFAAGAWEAQGNHKEAQHEMETLLEEDPKSGSAGQFGQILEEIKAEQVSIPEATLHSIQETSIRLSGPTKPTADDSARTGQLILQRQKEEQQIAEAKAIPASICTVCNEAGTKESNIATGYQPVMEQPGSKNAGTTLRITVDEVGIFFAATDVGKSVTNLTAADIKIRDDNQPPDAILAFRSESQLPLRLGLVIDTSDSVTDRFNFEQAAATRFLQQVMVNKDDLAFVVGVNNSVLLVQDFTTDQTLSSHALQQLAPGGGTALWDGVAFAADKLASHVETQPVARILVVISDGQDNSSSTTLKQAITRAQNGEVGVYTVSTREGLEEEPAAAVGNDALRTLSELTGGSEFIPGTVRRMDSSLAELQQVIRSRYLVSYKPAAFRRDGRYRTITIEAQKDGRKLSVFARKGYYAPAAPAIPIDH